MSPKQGPRFVAYYRVSTDRQGKSGLGLEAQRASVVNYLNGGTWELIGEFVEAARQELPTRRKKRPSEPRCVRRRIAKFPALKGSRQAARDNMKLSA